MVNPGSTIIHRRHHPKTESVIPGLALAKPVARAAGSRKLQSARKGEVMKKHAKIKLAGIVGTALIMLLFQAASGNAEVQLKDNYQQNYDFSKVKSIVIIPFYESFKSARLSGSVNSKNVIPESVDIFSMELFDTGINLIDRMQLDKVLSEQKLSLSGLMEKQDYRKIGKLVNADAILWGSISLLKQFGKRRGEITVRLIDVETGTIVYTSLGEKSDIWGGGDVTSFKNELMSVAGKKLVEFLKKSR
jgi:curli biogenesis system outer membrane secretion channel CsgG